MHEHDIEGELDAVLARYAAVEPRDGLEERVLANLRMQNMRAPQSEWLRWVAAGFAVVVLAGLAIWVGEVSGLMTAKPIVFQHEAANLGASGSPAAANASVSGVRMQVNSQRELTTNSVKRSRPQHVPPPMRVEVTPKLAQFPAPEPLSDAEKLLSRYVDEDPREAALIAEAQGIELRREKNLMNGTDADSSSIRQEQ